VCAAGPPGAAATLSVALHRRGDRGRGNAAAGGDYLRHRDIVDRNAEPALQFRKLDREIAHPGERPPGKADALASEQRGRLSARNACPVRTAKSGFAASPPRRQRARTGHKDRSQVHHAVDAVVIQHIRAGALPVEAIRSGGVEHQDGQPSSCSVSATSRLGE